MSANNNDTSALYLAAHAIRFAADHPYAATGIFGAAVGSVVTYGVMSKKIFPSFTTNGIFTPKVYEFALSKQDLHLLQSNPEIEIRLETPDAVLVITGEKREELKQLPDIIIDIDGD